MVVDDQNKSMNVLKAATNDDIEIISESFPVSISTAMINNFHSSSSADESLKSYLSKNYNTNILNVACKPQSNFISNVTCLNQLLKDFYESKLRRYKPYSTIKAKDILEVDDELDDEEQEEAEEGEEVSKSTINKDKVKSKQIIVIDDTNEEMHKPWITPDLIKLIKHRNLLQSKINENNSKSLQNDDELMKKFKNLRNKVTKLVKKARKDYVNKYGEENINKGESKTASSENKTSEAKSDSAHPATTTNSATTLANNTTDSQKGATTLANQQPSTNNQTVNSITSQLTGDNSFLKNQSTVMMNLYNTYFNQYIQQYTQQQQSMAAASTENADSYDALQKQATFYAQQQHALQQQLEQSLTQSAQQLIQEIANAAVAKTNQPFILNQFTHQQHHMHHHHHPMMGAQAPPAGALIHSSSVSNLRPPPPVMMPNMNQPQLAPPPNMFY
jgi:hypothetical protein